MSKKPSYLKLAKSGELKARAEAAVKMLQDCKLCPHPSASTVPKEGKRCLSCREFAVVESVTPHFGEEEVLVGRHGSGTIFSDTAISNVFSARTID